MKEDGVCLRVCAEGGVAWGEVWNLLDLPFRRSTVKCAGRMGGYRTASRDVSGRLYRNLHRKRVV